MKKLYIFKTDGGFGPTLYVKASNDIEAYKKARETLSSLDMLFELELIKVVSAQSADNIDTK